MTIKQITDELFKMQDNQYRAFQVRLIPNIPKDSVIGVRTLALKRFAKELYKASKLDKKVAGEIQEFFVSLPHQYFEHNQLHAFLISEESDFKTCVLLLEQFLPFIDNWATCDQCSPKVFKKNKTKLLPYIQTWLETNKTYTVRFAIGMLLAHFLDENFCPEYLDMVLKVQSEEYYVKMMQAWYFATALAKQYDMAIVYIESKRLDRWVHNKTIQKAIESYRITDEKKRYLRTLKL